MGMGAAPLAAVVVACVLGGCDGGSADHDASVDAAPTADAGPRPDADPSVPVALEPGRYTLTWTCVTGCAPLLFPPGTYGLVEVSDGLALDYSAPGTTETYAATGQLDVDDGCVAVTAFSWSVGTTDPYRYCSAIGGPEAEVAYRPDSGSLSTYLAHAIPE